MTMQERMKHKFDVCRVHDSQRELVIKLKAVCVLEEWQGADLEEGYKSNCDCSVLLNSSHVISKSG